MGSLPLDVSAFEGEATHGLPPFGDRAERVLVVEVSAIFEGSRVGVAEDVMDLVDAPVEDLADVLREIGEL